MIRRVFLLLACAIAASSFAGAAGAAGGGLQLTEARGASFPNRAYVVSLPSNHALTGNGVVVTENGNSVVDVKVQPASAVSKKTFGVVFVVDASQSMVGAPLQKAMAATRAFAASRNPNQQIALVVFNGTSVVVLPFTTASARIDAALSQVPKIAYGTHIYDAVAQAEAMLQQANIQSGSIVVLSDGADTGSQHKGSEVAAAARAAHIRLYTVGLNSPKFDRSTLSSLASEGGGEYTLAKSTSSLAPLFSQLSQRLAREYLVEYKSLASPQAKVKVNVQVPGVGSASSAYQAPALPVTTVPPYHRSIGQRIWGSPILMVVFALLVAGIISLFAYGVFATKGAGLPERMVDFVSVPGLQKKGEAVATTGVTDPDAAKPGMWARFDRKLEIAQIHMNGVTYVAWTVVATVLAFLLLEVITSSPWWALLALIVPFAAREYLLRKLARRRNAFAEQLPDALQVISSALRSGHSFAGALAVVVESSSEPMKSEMHRVVADEQAGIPLDRSLEVVAARMDNRDLEQVALVAQLQREAGSNAAEVIDRVAETIRDRFELRRLIKTLTVQGRMSRWIVTGLPIAIVLILQLINPHYLHPLVSSLGGKIVLILAAALCVAGSLVIKKIVDIKV